MLIGQQSSSCGSLEIILKTRGYRMCFRMCRISTALLPGRPAASLKPADAIGAFQIGFPVVEAAGDFPHGLRCDRQILCIRVCHSAPSQISSIAPNGKMRLIMLSFLRIHVLHTSQRVFTLVRTSIASQASTRLVNM